MEHETTSGLPHIKEENNEAKNKIILFVIGVLVGAVISTGAFFVYTTTLGPSDSNTSQMPGGTPPEMPNGQSGQGNQNGQPPEMPSNSSSSSPNSNNSNSTSNATTKTNNN